MSSQGFGIFHFHFKYDWMNTATPPYAFITYTGITSVIHKGSFKVETVNELAVGKAR
jgi:hypothetical protein